MTKERLRAYRTLKLETMQIRDLILGIEAERCGTLQALYRRKQEELAAELLAIEQAIAGLGVKERTILRDYYINGLSWDEVSEKNHYSLQHTHRLHAEALIALKGADGLGYSRGMKRSGGL